MACKYIYKGNEYTRGQILDQIMKGGLSVQVLDQQKARDEIKRITGMTDSQIEFVKGLIDGKALGRMLSDGNILLSEMSSESTAYHEAFHRVWQGSLTSEERNAAIKEFKTNKNWERLIEPYRASYGNDVDVRIEEYFADEFANFVLGEPTLKTFLQKLFAQLKKMLQYLGLAKQSEINRIYDLMNKGAYASRQSYQTFRQADQITINHDKLKQIKMTSDDYMSVVEAYHLMIMQDAIKQGNVESFFTPGGFSDAISINHSNIKERILDSIINAPTKEARLLKELKEKKGGVISTTNVSSTELKNIFEQNKKAIDLLKLYFAVDFDLANPNTSQIMQKYREYSKGLFKVINFEKVQKEPDIIDENEDSKKQEDSSEGTVSEIREVNTDSGAGAMFDMVAMEIDPNANMSSYVRILLSSLSNPKDVTILGLPRSYNWVAFANFLNNNLNNLPATEEAIFNRLDELKSNPQYGSGVSQLIDLLGGKNFKWNSEADNDIVNSRIRFVAHFSQNKYNFYVSTFTDKNIYSFDSSKVSTREKIKAGISTNFIIALSSGFDSNAKFIEELKKQQDIILNKETRTAEKNEARLKIVSLFGLNDEYQTAKEIEKTDKFLNLIFDISSKILKIKNNDYPKLLDVFSKKIDSVDIQGYVKELVALLEAGSKSTELSVLSATGEKLYSISLNSYMTQVVNEINYALDEINRENPVNKKAALFEKVPQLNTFYGQHSVWIDRLLDKNARLKLIVNDGLRTEKSKIQESLSDQEETALLTTYLNQLLDPTSPKIWQTVKHSDRSTLYAFAFENNRDAESILDYNNLDDISRVFGGYLDAEIDKIAALEKNNTGKDVQYYTNLVSQKDGKKVYNSLFSSRVDSTGKEVEILSTKDFEDLVKYSENKDSKEWREAKKNALDKIVAAVRNQATIDYNYLQKWNVFEMKNGKPVGVSKDVWENEYNFMKEFYENNGEKKTHSQLEKETLKRIASLYSINTLIGNIEQTILITGDPNLYKSSVDSFKRFSVWSSTGNLAVHGDLVSGYILGTEKDLRVKVGNKFRSYAEGRFSSNPNFISTLTYAEEEYMMQESFLENIKVKAYNSLYQLLINTGVSEDEAKKRAEKQSSDLREKYKMTNEPDGQSWMNFFEWRRTKIRWGQWSKAHERLFRMELDIFNGKDSFVVPENEDAQLYFNEFLGLAETIKGQYAGPYWNQESTISNGINVQGVAKTSFYPLLPSQIRGTKLEELNRNAVENGMGVIHVASARKVGVRLTLDEKGNSKNDEYYLNGLPKAYGPDGKLNFKKVDLDSAVQFMESKYFKHQVKIHNYEKENIISASQPHKLNLSNLMQHGVPIDYKGTIDEWNSLTEKEKIGSSEIYKSVDVYTSIAEKRMLDSIKDLEDELKKGGENNITQRLVDLLKETLKKRDTTSNVLDALDLFAEAEIKALEIIPNRGRIEPIMYSLVKNNVLTQKRNGNSVPQISSLFWEPKNKNRVSTGTKNKKGNVEASEELKMYEGENPYAEIMMPLPTKWLNALMKVYDTRDVIKLVDKINEDIAKGDYTKIDKKMLFVKGFRIPNQQLSSNDVFRIKKFFVPSNTAMVVVPPAIAVKVGSDFDIDKLNMYMPHGQLFGGRFRYLDANTVKQLSRINTDEQVEKLKRKEQENQLLEIEMKLMTMPINFMNLMKPTDDSQWEMARGKLKKAAEKKIEQYSDNPKLVEHFSALFTKPVSMFGVYTASTNVEKTRENIGSKGSVGQAAKAITNHAVSQLNDFKIRMTYDVGNKLVSRRIPFLKNDDGRIGRIFSVNGEFISDLYSGLLTIQVDAVKDPKAKALGLVTQSMNMANYLLKRGADPEHIVFFLSQPAIRDYIKFLATYQSAAYIESGAVSSMSEAAKLAYNKAAAGYIPYVKNSNLEEMKQDIEAHDKFIEVINDFDLYYQIPLLDLFMDLMDQTQDDQFFIGAVGIDTFKPKSMADILDKKEKIEKAMSQTSLIENLDELYAHPLLRPFKATMDLYSELYSQYYLYTNSVLFPYFRNRVNWSSKTADKIKLMKILPEEFVTYLVQNNEEFKKEYPFEEIMAGKQSLAKQIKDFKNEQKERGYSFRVLDALIPQLFATDALNGKKLSHLKKVDFGENPFQIEEYATELEEIREINPKLYNNLVAYTIYTYGYSSSMYSLDRFMPVKQQKGIDTIGRYQLAQKELKSFFSNKTNLGGSTMPVFLDLFDTVNPMLLKADKDWTEKFEAFLELEFSKGIRNNLMFRKNINGKQIITLYKKDLQNYFWLFPNGGYGYKLYNNRFTVFNDEIIEENYQYDEDIDETNPKEYLGSKIKEEKPKMVVKETSTEQQPVQPTTPSVSTVDKARPEFSKLPQKSATPTMTYAGIGSRETPPEILAQMTELAKELESKGYTLRSGGAQGADTAFEKGVSAKKEIFPGSKIAGEREMKIAREIHPNPQALDNSKSPAFIWNLMARNTNQVFGENLDTPVDFVIAWTQDALTDYRKRSIKSGGTGQAIDMASRKGIPIINMANKNWREQLNAVLSVSTGTTAPEVSSAVVKPETKEYSFEYKGVSIPTDFQLSSDQENALKELINFYDSNESAMMLQGAAGTGKTSIIGYLQKYLSKKNRYNEPILYSAPTHAATVELGFATVKTGNKQLPLTVASMKKYDRNLQKYVLSNKASGIIDGGKIIVVDESSMLSSRDYNEIITVAKGGYKVIFLGDKKQIPEVIATGEIKEKSVSKAFTDHKVVNLDVIHRTSNPDIKNVLQKIRDSKEFQLYKTKENTKNLVFYNSEIVFKKKLLQTVSNDPQNTDYIGYTNTSVSNMNKMIREKAFGRTGELQPGDIIMGYLGYASKQIASRPEVLGNLANSVTYKIDSVEVVKKLNYSGDLEYTGYLIIASSERLLELKNKGMMTSEKAETTYLPLSPMESIENRMTKEDYNKNNEYLSDRFKSLFDVFQRLKDNGFSASTKEDKLLWRSYFEQEALLKGLMTNIDLADNYIYNYKTNRFEKENSSDSQKELKKYYGSQAQAFKIEKGIDFGHAITIHKSQGRTTKNVFFDANTLTKHDIIIKENGKQISTERQSLGYVAMSRASQNLYVYEGATQGIDFEEIDNADINLDDAVQQAENDSIEPCI